MKIIFTMLKAFGGLKFYLPFIETFRKNPVCILPTMTSHNSL